MPMSSFVSVTSVEVHHSQSLGTSNKMHIKRACREDYVSDLPESINEIILTKMPLRDAVRTSILSSKWRYKWATLTELQFDDTCVSNTRGRALVETNLIRFVNQFLLLHDGPIKNFILNTIYLRHSSFINQWLLYLSRKHVEQLDLMLAEGVWFKAPCLFSCKKLVSLRLVRCELDPPLHFKGFLYLKHLVLEHVRIASDAAANLISSCPLLENLGLLDFTSLGLTIRAPNLKSLLLQGEFKNICLENTPMLVLISVAMCMDDGILEHFGQSSSCNFDKFLGGVPSLEKLFGRSQFTMYMSIGNTLWKAQTTFLQLKFIGLDQVSFNDMKEIMVILRLILSAPNLLELYISGLSNSSLATKPPDLDFWEKECVYDNKFERLEVVMMKDMSGFPHEMKFMEFLLGSSPVLEVMGITSSDYVAQGGVDTLLKLPSFKRASPEAELIFYDEV